MKYTWQEERGLIRQSTKQKELPSLYSISVLLGARRGLKLKHVLPLLFSWQLPKHPAVAPSAPLLLRAQPFVCINL